MILEQSTLKRDSRSHKKFRTNLETPRRNTERNHQQTIRLKYILLYLRNLYVITGESTTVQVLGMCLGPKVLILREEKELTKVSKSILKDRKLDVYAMTITVFYDVKKKSENKKMEQLKLIYFENSWLPLAITLQILQTKTMLKAEGVYLKKIQEDFGTVLVLIVQQQSKRRKYTVIMMMAKKNYKKNTDRVLTSVKEREFFSKNTNTYSKDQYKTFLKIKQILNDERKGWQNGFKKYGQFSVSFQQISDFLVRKKMKVQKCKITKKYVENQKFSIMYAFAQHRHNYNIQKIFLAHKTTLSHIKTQHPALKRKMTKKKKLRKQQSTVFIAIRESKIRETEMETLSELYYMQPSVKNNNFLTIIRGEVFISEMNQMKSSVYTVELLKHLMQPFQKVNKYFSVAQKGFRNSALKALVEKKRLGTESSLSMSHLRKHICQGPSVVERTKRSAKGENVQISVGRFY